jgi:hypothetical protein
VVTEAGRASGTVAFGTTLPVARPTPKISLRASRLPDFLFNPYSAGVAPGAAWG